VELGLTDLHGVNGFHVHDVEAATSIHQYLGEPCVADDGVDNQRISARLRDMIWVVIMIKSDGQSRLVEEGWRGWLNGVNLSAFQLTLALRIVSREATKDLEAIIDDKEIVFFLTISPIILEPFTGIAFPLGTPEEVVFHHSTILEGVLDRVPVVRARFVKHLVKNSWAPLGRGLGVLALSDGNKGILAQLLSLFLLFEVMAGAAFIGVLLLLLFSLDVVENCPYRFLVGSKVGGNV
jgi:hypothetical protein